MRPIARKLFTYYATASLLLFIVTAALWARSYWVADRIGWVRWQDQSKQIWRGWGARSQYDRLTFWSFTAKVRFEDPTALDGKQVDNSHIFWHAWDSSAPEPDPKDGWLKRAGFDWHSVWFPDRDDNAAKVVFVSIPTWVLLAVFAPAPVWRWRHVPRHVMRLWMIRRQRRRLRFAGLCAGCGYNLCASPKRCPECGQIRAHVVPLLPVELNKIRR